MIEEELFHRALEKPTLAEQLAFLDEVCADQPELRQRVERLLRSHRHEDSFLQPGVTTDEPAAERLGTVIGAYKLIEPIGEGGMGTVWMAQQTEPIKRLVAIKLIKAGMDSKAVIVRFEAERQALALMDHANIARVLDAGTTSAGRPYFVMDLVKGVPITRYCDEHHLTPRQRLELFIPICQAVQHAHQKGIIHRDLKPSNVLVALYDGKPVPKVIDFGVAKAAGQSLTDKTLVTGFGAIVGTLEYMSPEQAEVNQLDIDTRSDIYSLGVLLYELLTGSPPFSRKELEKAGMLEMLRMIREQEPSKPSTKLSDVGRFSKPSHGTSSLASIAANRGTEPAKLTKLVRGELDWIVMKALEKDRNRRYETANGFAMDVQRYLADEQVLACPPSVGYRFGKFARRHKVGLAVGGLILFFIVLLGSGVGWVVRDREAREQELARQREARQAKLAGDMQLALERAELFQSEGKRAEALAAFERAEMLSDEAASDAAVQQRLTAVKERLDAEARDQEFVARFEEIRLVEQSRVHEEESRFLWESCHAKLKELLREYGVEVGVTPPAKVVARIQARPGLVQRHLVAALHECLQNAPEADASSRQWLTAVLDSADNDPWRKQVRQVWAAKDRAALEDLAGKVDVRTQPPSFLLWVAAEDPKKGDAAFLGLLRRIQQAYPADFWANHDLARALKWSGQPGEAVRFYTAAVALRSDNPGVYVNRGSALVSAKEWDAAVADFRQAIALAPRYASAHFNLGVALSFKKDIKGAIAAYRQAIDLDPELAKAHCRLGNALYDNGDLKGAIAAYRRAIALNSQDAEAHCNLGVALRDKGDVEGAIRHYRQAIAINSNYATPHYNLGLALHANGDFEGAIAAYRRAIAINPNHATAHNNLGVALADKGDVDGAIAAYRRAIAINPNHATAHNNLGNALRGTGDLKGAIAAFRRAIDLDPKYTKARINLERALLALSLWKEAAADLSERLNNGSTSPTEDSIALAGARLLLGDVEGYQELCREMLPHLEKAKTPYTAYILSRTNGLSEQGPTDAAQALRWAEKAVAASKSAWYLHALGRAHLRAGNFDQAIQQCQESLKKGAQWRGKILNWLILALAHHNLGQTKEATQWLHHAEAWQAKLPKGKDGKAVSPPSLHVADWVEFHVLYREAEALLKASIETK